MESNYTTRPHGYTIRACEDVDCASCPINHNDACMMSDDYEWRKRNGWTRVPVMVLFREEVQHDNV